MDGRQHSAEAARRRALHVQYFHREVAVSGNGRPYKPPPPWADSQEEYCPAHWGAPSYPRTTRRPHDGSSIAGLPLMDAHAFLNPPRAEVTDRAPQNVPVAGYTQSGLRFSRRTTCAPCCNIVQHAATQSDTSHSMGLPVGGFWSVCWRVVFIEASLNEMLSTARADGTYCIIRAKPYCRVLPHIQHTRSTCCNRPR